MPFVVLLALVMLTACGSPATQTPNPVRPTLAPAIGSSTTRTGGAKAATSAAQNILAEPTATGLPSAAAPQTAPATIASGTALTTETAPAGSPSSTTVPSETATLPPPITPVASSAQAGSSATLTQLTAGGCCPQPFWSSDSNAVLYLDKPTASSPTGYYRVPIDGAGIPAPELWSDRIAFYTNDLKFAIIPEAAGTRVIRLSDNKEFRIRNGGRQVQISPDGTRVVWVETRDTFPIENRVSNVMLANLDGSDPGRIMQMLRGGVTGWLDDHRLLMNGRLSRETEKSTLFVYDLTTGARTDLVTAERMRTTQPSPDGRWLLYSIVNDPDPALNGMWVVRMDGTQRKKLDLFGAVQWRDGSRFVYVPLEFGAPSHAFYEYDAATGGARRLTPTEGPAFKIGNGDWDVSPDGNKIVFVNAADNNLWLWRFDR